MDARSREIVERMEVSTTYAGLAGYFDGLACSRVALEVGAHSPWMSRCIEERGHEVVVGNPSHFRGVAPSPQERPE